MEYQRELFSLVAVSASLLCPSIGLGQDALESNTPAASPYAISAGYKLVGWNDWGMHCLAGQDYSIFAVLPPYNTIHAHLMDPSGKLIKSGTGYTVTYQAVVDPLTNSINTTSVPKTNFWQYALKLGFGVLQPDQGIKDAYMPGPHNTPRPMAFSSADNTFTAAGIPITPYADAVIPPYPQNYFPMMRLVAKNSAGTVLATTDIVLPTSDEMSCKLCHGSTTGTLAARPAAGWVNNADPLKDAKLNILRKHDDRFQSTALYQHAAPMVGYSTQGLEQTVNSTPVVCDRCHGSNALAMPGVSGIKTLTAAVHGLHASVVDAATNMTLESMKTRDSCYLCHPGPKTQCLRGAMGQLKNQNGSHIIECQSCHGTLSAVAVSTRQGWLDEPNCQGCHTGTATHNNGQIAYTSVFTSGTTKRLAIDQTFATNANTPASGISLYRFSNGHGGVQCEGCHGSTHAEYGTPIANDNVQSNSLQGHAGMISECTACHTSDPNTSTGGPHGLHPIGQSWVDGHHDALDRGGTAQCQACHGADYRGTILSRALADRSFSAGDWGVKAFARGTIIGCYSCHNGPNPD
jgi:hypothetical protein